MSKEREALKLALEALELWLNRKLDEDTAWQAHTSLRQAITEAEKQEPVAWRFKTATFWNREPHWRYVLSLEGTAGLRGLEPLYTHPQPKAEQEPDDLTIAYMSGFHDGKKKREWVELTDEQLSALAEEFTGADGLDEVDFGRAVMAKYRGMNT